MTPEANGATGIVLAPEVPLASALAEGIRAALWVLSREGTEAVFVTRLLNAVRPVAIALRARLRGVHQGRPGAAGAGDPVDPPAQDVGEMIRDTLHELEVLGDVVSLPRGYWLPAPPRVVPLVPPGAGDEPVHVLLGGAPTHLLPDGLRAAIAPGGLARVLRFDEHGGSDLLAGYSVQPDASWRSRPNDPIDVWAQAVLTDTTLEPFEDPTVAFEAYAPAVVIAARRRSGSVQRVPSQYFRWTGAAQVPDGRYVVRHEVAFGRRYALAEIRRTRVCALGEPALGGGDWRRLFYGIDALEEEPTEAIVRASKGTAPYHLTMSGFLPGPELRLFTALGRLNLPQGDRYLPQTWEIAAHAVAEALMALRNDLRMSLRDALP